MLKKDARWDLCDLIDRDDKEKLYDEHIEVLTKRNKEMFHSLLNSCTEVSNIFAKLNSTIIIFIVLIAGIMYDIAIQPETSTRHWSVVTAHLIADLVCHGSCVDRLNKLADGSALLTIALSALIVNARSKPELIFVQVQSASASIYLSIYALAA